MRAARVEDQPASAADIPIECMGPRSQSMDIERIVELQWHVESVYRTSRCRSECQVRIPGARIENQRTALPVRRECVTEKACHRITDRHCSDGARTIECDGSRRAEVEDKVCGVIDGVRDNSSQPVSRRAPAGKVSIDVPIASG